jgi:hypothetical protein
MVCGYEGDGCGDGDVGVLGDVYGFGVVCGVIARRRSRRV